MVQGGEQSGLTSAFRMPDMIAMGDRGAPSSQKGSFRLIICNASLHVGLENAEHVWSQESPDQGDCTWPRQQVQLAAEQLASVAAAAALLVQHEQG